MADPADQTKLRAPKGASSCSVAGVEYPVKRGIVAVHIDHVARLLAAGFARADDAEDKDPE